MYRVIVASEENFDADGYIEYTQTEDYIKDDLNFDNEVIRILKNRYPGCEVSYDLDYTNYPDLDEEFWIVKLTDGSVCQYGIDVYEKRKDNYQYGVKENAKKFVDKIIEVIDSHV